MSFDLKWGRLIELGEDQLNLKESLELKGSLTRVGNNFNQDKVNIILSSGSQHL